MSQANPAENTVNRTEFQEQVEKLLNEVTHEKIRLTIEEDGQPVAVLAPAEFDERRRARSRFLRQIEEMQRRANLSEEEAEQLALEAVQAVRSRSS
jgi:PHD/YefM family antitoxin component YafN of YafNO toxin-antitoxin module